MTSGTQGDQVRQLDRLVSPHFSPRYDMSNLGSGSPASWDRAAMPSFNKNGTLKRRWDVRSAFGHMAKDRPASDPPIEHAVDVSWHHQLGRSAAWHPWYLARTRSWVDYAKHPCLKRLTCADACGRQGFA